ncbi:hypothetical protein B0H19DRAFT_1109202 [Mycena capillaripes]|nr:hypothetical protein B0H19DRAFT_1109202 [Mycena capillaripes]
MLASVPRSSSTLPPYYRSCDGVLIPPYTAEPSLGEECLSRPSSSRSPRTGEFTAGNGRITLTLKEQPDNSLVPTYAPNDLVTGTIWIQGCESVTEVVLKLSGRMDLAASNGGQPRELVRDSYTVWNDSLRFLCPASIPFSFIFPTNFKDTVGQSWPLPPSIRITPPGKPFIYVKCTYSISVVVSTALHPRFSLWRGEKTLSVAVNFNPIAYPPRPIMPDISLLPTIKTASDEWYQILCNVGNQLQPKNVHCSLFIPSALIYGLSDSIPFHLQISGPAATLLGLVRPSGRYTTEKRVRVHLMRRVSLFVCGETQHRCLSMGEGALSVLPPPISCFEEPNSHEAAIDWAGTVRCDASITAGTFDAGALYVKDFIVVSIPAWNMEHKHRVRFVSNTWVDDAGPGDRV